VRCHGQFPSLFFRQLRRLPCHLRG
jgi:hypothetical protein